MVLVAVMMMMVAVMVSLVMEMVMVSVMMMMVAVRQPEWKHLLLSPSFLLQAQRMELIVGFNEEGRSL